VNLDLEKRRRSPLERFPAEIVWNRCEEFRFTHIVRWDPNEKMFCSYDFEEDDSLIQLLTSHISYQQTDRKCCLAIHAIFFSPFWITLAGRSEDCQEIATESSI